VTDVAENTASISRTINIDTTKPVCSITKVPESRTGGDVTLTATVTEANPDKYSWT
jgi:hypothetical protein